MKRKILSFLLAVIMLATLVTPALAVTIAERTREDVSAITCDTEALLEEIINDILRANPNLSREDIFIGETEYFFPDDEYAVTNEVAPRFGWTITVTTVRTQNVNNRVVPAGQPVNGTWVARGDGMIINTTGGTSFTFTGSVAWGPFSITATRGSVNAGVGSLVNNNGNGGFFRAEVAHVYSVRQERVRHYFYGVFQHATYRTVAVISTRTPLIIRL